MNRVDERVIGFDCEGDRLIGILHSRSDSVDTVFVMIVGGPQYRVGSHRMFVDLARAITTSEQAVLRFDCRGMGDSDGTFLSFEQIANDIRSAVDCAVGNTSAYGVVLVGLCDGASAAAMYAPTDDRVRGLVLLNPWVRTEAGQAKATVRHYYGMRLLQREFWRRLGQGEIDLRRSIEALVTNFRSSVRVSKSAGFIDLMIERLSSFGGRIIFVLSENDLTAQEFDLLSRSSPTWAQLLKKPNVSHGRLVAADHTFSGPGQIGRAADMIIEWYRN